MKISGVDPKTGKIFQKEAAGINGNFITAMSELELSEAGVKKLIDNLDISADAKSILHSLSSITIRAGEFIIKIGRKIIDFICSIFRDFPTATFGIVFGSIVGFLISSIPVLGIILGPIVTPILISLGLLAGVYEDIKDKNLSRKIAEINAKFSALNS